MKNRTADISISPNQDTPYSEEEALTLILNNLDDLFLLVDRNLRVMLTNEYTRQKVREYFGLDVIIGMNALDLAPRERHKDLEQIYGQVFKGVEFKTSTEVQTANKTIYFEHSFRPARNKSGEVTAAMVSTRNITDRKKEEFILKELEERWRFALEGGKLCAWDWNIETGSAFYSDSFKKLYGYDAEEFNGTIDKWKRMIHPDDKKRMDAAIKEHMASSDPFYESTYRIRAKDGSYKWILARGVIVSRNEKGDAIRMIGTHMDITDQVNTEEQLRISNDRYRNVILATSDIIYDWDIKTGKIFWSDNYTKALGWELPEDKKLHITTYVDHIHPADRSRVENTLAGVIDDTSKTNWQEEYRYKKADGNYAYVSDRGYIIRNNNREAIRMTGAMEDITERKQNEQLLFLERMVFEMSANLQTSLSEIVQALLHGVHEMYPEAGLLVLLLKDDETVESLGAIQIPELFLASLNGRKLCPEDGPCGESMHTKQIVFVEDIQSGNLSLEYASVALRHGLRSCWCFPIFHGADEVLGCFAVYHKQPKSPSVSELNILERIRNILRVVTEHYWSLNEIRLAHERFDIIMKATNDLIWDWNLETNIIYRDEVGLRNVFGLDSNEPIKGLYQWLGRLHPEDQGRAEEMIHTIATSAMQDTFEIEYRFRRGDGTYADVYDRGRIIRNSEGKPVRMIGAAQDVTERKRLEQELLENELERQKAINQATVDTQEQERSEIGKELHDNVNQVLTTTKLYLDLAATNAELKDELIQKSNKNIVSVINEIRQLSRSLMDPSIGDLGLVDSLHDLIQSINLTGKLHINLSAERKIEALLNKNQKLTVFRIIQEALNNAIRHAKATTVSVAIRASKKIIELKIQDNGIGFDPGQIKKGAGLKNIQNRIYLINGSHSIQSAAGKGCIITINFPVTSKPLE
jgi:PAS domain S-box-containing protein